MAKLVHIPESTLEGLLREAGRTESVAEYLRSATVQGDVQEGQRLLRRARAAYWSRFWLLASAFLTWVFFLPGPSIEGFISGVLLTGMTIVEFKVHSFFLAADTRGAIYGWWNQCLFSVLFIIYGLYHGTYVTPAPELEAWVDPSMMPMLATMERMTYYSIAFVGGLGQFALACYYRAARK